MTKLVNKDTGAEVKVGDTVTSFRGEKAIVKYLEPPHKPSASGRVYVTQEGMTGQQGFYASVFGLKYVDSNS